MSRCRCCNSALTKHEIPRYNKTLHQEEDFCSHCQFMSKHASVEKEYVGGRYPSDGATPAKSSTSEY